MAVAVHLFLYAEGDDGRIIDKKRMRKLLITPAHILVYYVLTTTLAYV